MDTVTLVAWAARWLLPAWYRRARASLARIADANARELEAVDDAARMRRIVETPPGAVAPPFPHERGSGNGNG